MNSYKATNEAGTNLDITGEWKYEEEDHSFNFDKLIIDIDEEIFVYDQDETFHQSEADEFNALYGTHYTQENLKKFTNYREHYGLEVEDAIDYVQTCHCCNEQLDIFAGEYCSGGCHNHVEELGLPCFRGAECLICNNDTFPQQQCDDCSSEITYQPFEYYYDDEIHNVDSIHYVCNACFCRNSNYCRRHVRTYPIRDHPCHNPLANAIYCCNELQVYNQINDLQVWSDLYQYMY